MSKLTLTRRSWPRNVSPTAAGCNYQWGITRDRIDDMSVSSRRIKSICRVLIGLLFFTQLTVASYACPRLSDVATMGNIHPAAPLAAQETALAAAPMSADCDQVDQEAANLCVEHCRPGQQSAEASPAPVVHAATATLLYSLPSQPVQVPGFGRTFPAVDVNVAAAPPPPHAIVHCVFRI